MIDFASPVFMTDLIYAFLTEVMDFVSLSLKLRFFPLKEKKTFINFKKPCASVFYQIYFRVILF